MKLPRDISGEDLMKAMIRIGYQVDRQVGSHIRLSHQAEAEHHITIPNHAFIKVGTLSGILNSVSSHLNMSKEKLARTLFD